MAEPAAPPKPLLDLSSEPKHKYTFPPFPFPLSGVTVMPFKQFKQRGIRMDPLAGDADEKEVDALGIPTIPIKKVHDTDECKTNKRRKRKRGGGDNKKGVEKPQPKKWWEQWMEGEERRAMKEFDMNAPRIDRLYQAAADFKSGRPWPASQKLIGIPEVWDQFRRYIGISDNAAQNSTVVKVKAPILDDEDDDEEMSDDGDFDGPRVPGVAGDDKGQGIVIAADEGEGSGIIDPKKLLVDQKHEREEKLKEERLLQFLDDPERSVKIYLSSYCRAKGYIWATPNLDNIPLVLSFFLKFLRRSNVFPDSDPGLKRAIEIVDVAGKELPATGKAAHAWPDAVSRACKETWGGKGVGYQRVGGEGWDVGNANEKAEEEDEKLGKRQKTDEKASWGWGGKEEAETPGWPVKEEASATSIDIGAPPTADFNVIGSLPGDANDPASMNGGWGAAPFVNSTANQGGWGATDDAIPSTWGEMDTGVKAMDTDAASPWADAAVNSWGNIQPETLLPLLGPTALPLTHTAGVVETSMRRIKKIENPLLTAETSPPSDGPSAEAVEQELGKSFAQIVLSPWLDWDEAGDIPHLSKPKIMDTSRGPVVDPAAAPAFDAAPLSHAVKPHDPIKDDIILLVDPQDISFLTVGMGFAGTWVQIARVSDLEGDTLGVDAGVGAAAGGEPGKEKEAEEVKEVARAKSEPEPNAGTQDKNHAEVKEDADPDSKQDGEEAKKKRKKKKSKAKNSKTATTRYWYLEEMTMIIPSFWSV